MFKCKKSLFDFLILNNMFIRIVKFCNVIIGANKGPGQMHAGCNHMGEFANM